MPKNVRRPRATTARCAGDQYSHGPAMVGATVCAGNVAVWTGCFLTCFARCDADAAVLHDWRRLVTTHGFGSTSGATLAAGAETYWSGVVEDAESAPAARITPARATMMSTAGPTAAVAGERESVGILIIDYRPIVYVRLRRAAGVRPARPDRGPPRLQSPAPRRRR